MRRVKHVVIKYHFHIYYEGRVGLVYFTTNDMVADIMTKPANKLKLKKVRLIFGV